jgi:hypothetical protein
MKANPIALTSPMVLTMLVFKKNIEKIVSIGSTMSEAGHKV